MDEFPEKKPDEFPEKKPEGVKLEIESKVLPPTVEPSEKWMEPLIMLGLKLEIASPPFASRKMSSES